MSDRRNPRRRNPVAKALSLPAYRPKVVGARKGKGSYRRATAATVRRGGE